MFPGRAKNKNHAGRFLAKTPNFARKRIGGGEAKREGQEEFLKALKITFSVVPSLKRGKNLFVRQKKGPKATRRGGECEIAFPNQKWQQKKRRKSINDV